MTTFWRDVDNKCIICKEVVAKISLKAGKIVVEKYYDKWGGWHKVQKKSEMQVMCCACQKREQKKRNKTKSRPGPPLPS
jgi:hypothetical protein